MAKMMVKNIAGISRAVTLLIVAIAITDVMIGTCAAARNELTEQQQQQQLLWTSNILLRGLGVSDGGKDMVDNKLSCIPSGQPCDPWGSMDCCPGSRCHVTAFPVPKCVWCPSKGDSCGLLDSCCPGLSCDGNINGKCH